MDELGYRKKILNKCQVEGKLLDIGAGPVSTIAAKEFDCDVVCVDISEDAFETEKNNAKEHDVQDKITFKKADALALPFADNYFDWAISYGALHHIDLDKRDKFVDEMLRVANSIIIADFNKQGFPHGDDYQMVDYKWLEEKLDSFEYFLLDDILVYVIRS
ncbi:MAG: class I SAM-dependent methyltransferase [Nanobdellota archaeon]